MKKYFFAGATLLLSLCFFISCNSGGGSGEAYTIKMRLNKNDSFVQNLTMNMVTNTAIMGQSMDVKMKMDIGCLFNVIENTGKEKIIKMTYTKSDIKMDMGGKLAGMNQMSDSLLNKNNNNIAGKSVTFTLSENNEITSISGADKIIVPDSMDAATRQMMEKMFSKEQMNSMFGMIFSMYPKKPVKAGESWNTDMKLNIAGLDIKTKLKYTLVGVKNGLADIDVAGIIAGKGKIAKEAMSMEMDMTGSQKGMLTIKTADGYLNNGSYKMDLKATMEVMGQTIPMTIKGDYTIKGN